MQGEIQNITTYLSNNAKRFPNKPAILHPRRISFAELNAEVDCYAEGLKNNGFGKGTRTIMMVSAGPEFFILCFALLRIGAVPVMIDPGMGIRAMTRALRGTMAEAFIGNPGSHLLRALYPTAFRSIKIWISTGKVNVPGAIKSTCLRQEPNHPVEHCRLEGDNIAGIFFTSGSTGPPKGVVYLAGTMEAQVRLMKEHFQYGPEDVDLCTFPLLGLFVNCLGSSLVIADMNPLQPASLDPIKLIRNIKDHGCTQMFGSPMILNRLARYSKESPFTLPSLNRIISAGAPVPIGLIRSFLDLCHPGAIVHTPYGATEALPVCDIRSDELLRQTREEQDCSGGICVGYPLQGIELAIIKISDSVISRWTEDILCTINVVGEIVVKGALVTRSYYNNERINELAKISDGRDGGIWHRMGDLGRLDGLGRVWFYGRKNQRVELQDRTLFTIPTEAVFNIHNEVYRSALIGANIRGKTSAVICIQPEQGIKKQEFGRLKEDLLTLASKNLITHDIHHLLFHPDFPVDPRHNAKIFREKLAIWADRRLR